MKKYEYCSEELSSLEDFLMKMFFAPGFTQRAQPDRKIAIQSEQGFEKEMKWNGKFRSDWTNRERNTLVSGLNPILKLVSL